MSGSRASRITVVSGVLFVVLALVAFLGFSRSGYPDSGDGAAKIAAYFTEHRGAALTQEFLFGLSLVAGLGFVAGIVALMWRSEAARPLAVVAGVTGAAGAAVSMVGTALVMVLAYRPPVGDPGLMRALFDGGYITLNVSGLMFGAFITAASVAALRAQGMPRWTGEVGLPVAALQVVGAACLARGDGIFSPMGLIPIIAILALMVWTLCVCVALRRPQEAASAAPTAPAPA